MKIRKMVAALAALLPLSLVSPATAGAEDSVLDYYLADLSSAGLPVPGDVEAEVIALGLSVCVDMYNGQTFNGATAVSVENGMSRRDAEAFVAISVTWLCPSAVGTGGVS